MSSSTSDFFSSCKSTITIKAKNYVFMKETLLWKTWDSEKKRENTNELLIMQSLQQEKNIVTI